ncbi:hypothetical protein GCM10009826_24880 [Humibacillus xanthopallidus]
MGVLWRRDLSDVHMVIHNQWTSRDRSASGRTGLGQVTLCTQLWMDLWMTVHGEAPAPGWGCGDGLRVGVVPDCSWGYGDVGGRPFADKMVEPAAVRSTSKRASGSGTGPS